MLKNQRLVIVCAVLVIVAVCLSAIDYLRGTLVVTEKRFQLIPKTIGSWVGEDRTFSDAIYDELRADENFFRIYTREDGVTVGLYIGYYGTARGGHPDHVPTGCYPGAGWGIESITPLSIDAGDGSQTIEVNSLYATKGDRAEQTLYWLQNFRGTVTRRGLEQNIEKMKTRFFYNRNDGAFIRINASVSEGQTRDDVIAYQRAFAAELLPLLGEYWPIEEVQRGK